MPQCESCRGRGWHVDPLTHQQISCPICQVSIPQASLEKVEPAVANNAAGAGLGTLFIDGKKCDGLFPPSFTMNHEPEPMNAKHTRNLGFGAAHGDK